MTRLRIGTSYWLDRSGRPSGRFPKIHGPVDADVAIVGGGITGCACAYRLAASGARVVLLESQDIGHGSTAASTALLMQEPDVDLRDLEDKYGRRSARLIWHASQRAVQAFIRTLRYLEIDADLHALPSIYFSRDASAARDLRRELDARHRAGIRGRWLSPVQLARMTAIEGAGAILTRGNAQVDPYRACVGLAQAARHRGAKIFSHSKVRRIRAQSDHVGIELEHGRVTASRVIIATGYATAEFKPLAGRFRMLDTYVVTTPRLTTATRRELGLGDVMLWDTERPYHYARWTPDDRLIFGGHDRPHRPGRSRRAAIRSRAELLVDDLGDLYPTLQGVRPAYAWEGLFASTPDGLPYIGSHRRYPRHLFALGYGGNGITFGFLAAQILSRAVRGRSHASDALFAFNRERK